jgi:hypothetical protein
MRGLNSNRLAYDCNLHQQHSNTAPVKHFKSLFCHFSVSGKQLLGFVLCTWQHFQREADRKRIFVTAEFNFNL